jgi:hypothetical protein
MALRSCLSLKQVRQLEEGGSESFYSESVKLTAAKKVASLLGLLGNQAQIQPNLTLTSNRGAGLYQPLAFVDQLQTEAQALEQRALSSKWVAPTEIPLSPLTPADATHPRSAASKVVSTTADKPAPKATHRSLWVMTGLFAAALLFAAWMNPKAELITSDVEPPPPQTLSLDAPDFASSAAVVASESVEAASP